jgi:hypothetical protein
MTKEELDTDIINIVCKHIRGDLGQLVITLTRGSVKACLNDMGSLTRTQLNDIFRISHDIIHGYIAQNLVSLVILIKSSLENLRDMC